MTKKQAREMVNRGIGWLIAMERHDWWKPVLKAHKKGKLDIESDKNCILGVNGYKWHFMNLSEEDAGYMGLCVELDADHSVLQKEWVKAAKRERERYVSIS